MGDETGYHSQGFSRNDAKTLAWTKEVHAQNRAQAKKNRTLNNARAVGARAPRGVGAGANTTGGELVAGIVLILIAIGIGIQVLQYLFGTLLPWILDNWFLLGSVIFGYSVLAYSAHRRAASLDHDHGLPEILVLLSAFLIFLNAPDISMGKGILLFSPHITALVMGWTLRVAVQQRWRVLRKEDVMASEIKAQTLWYRPIVTFLKLVVGLFVVLIAVEWIAGELGFREEFDFIFANPDLINPYVLATLVYALFFGLFAHRGAHIGRSENWLMLVGNWELKNGAEAP